MSNPVVIGGFGGQMSVSFRGTEIVIRIPFETNEGALYAMKSLAKDFGA